MRRCSVALAAGLYGDWAKGRGAALGQDDAVDAGSVGHPQQRAQVLRISDAVEGEDKASLVGLQWLDEMFEAEQLLRADDGDDSLVRGGSSDLGELVAGLLADTDSGLAAGSDETGKSNVVTLTGNENEIKAAPAGFEGLLDGMEAVENIHEVSLRAGGISEN